jgi:hypothetical protein
MFYSVELDEALELSSSSFELQLQWRKQVGSKVHPGPGNTSHRGWSEFSVNGRII